MSGDKYVDNFVCDVVQDTFNEFRAASLTAVASELLAVLRARQVPMNGRSNAGKARSVLCGLYTRRGMGIGKSIGQMAKAVGLIHRLAQFRPGEGATHPYTSIMINHTPCLDVHRDDYNATLNWVFVLDAQQSGGALWVDACSTLKRVRAPGELELDSDVFMSTSADKCMGAGSRLRLVSLPDTGLTVGADVE
eukprot:6486040-Amphidinium_carterae.3